MIKEVSGCRKMTLNGGLQKELRDQDMVHMWENTKDFLSPCIHVFL